LDVLEMQDSIGRARARRSSDSSPTPAGLHRFIVATAIVTFILIFVGGLVTSTGSALAVPDWPLSFGKFFPKMEGGVLYEHGHRMVAGTVAILTLVVMTWALMRERSTRIRHIAVIAFGLVIFQAVLGGLTVLLLLPLPIAVAHAATAQAFFCLMVTLALLTGQQWNSAVPLQVREQARPLMPTLAAITTAAIYGQILIGAVMRHMGAGLVIPDFPLSFGRVVPPLDSVYVAINFAHRCGALVVSILIVWTVIRVLRYYADTPMLLRPAMTLLLLLAAQVGLGAITIWSGRAVLPTTAHVAVGAGVLATSLALTLRSYHLLSAPGREASASAAGLFASGNRIEREVTA
jgi:cytochrome c oxidase assembly protein subunit 15